MDKLIKLHPESARFKTVKTPAGGELQIELSIYDIPRSVSSSRASNGQLLLNFNYLDQEDQVQHGVDDLITLVLGKHSGKLMGIIVNEQGNFNTIKLMIEALKKMEPTLQHENQKMNFGLAEEILEKQGKELMMVDA